MIRAAILCRVSTTAQADNTSLADQRRILCDICQRQGWDFDVFDEVESGGAGIANRPILAQILGRIAAGDYQRLVVLVPDRLSRSGVGELEQIGVVLSKVGAKLVTQSGEFDPSNLDHGLALDLQAVLAKNERLRIRERTMRGREAVVRAGGFAGHPTPYGWVRVWEADGRTRFDIVPEEAAIIRQIYDTYLAGIVGIELLAAQFGLTYHRVSNILRSPRYAGIERFRGTSETRSGLPVIEVPSTVWPAIVTVEQWQAAVDLLARKTTHKSGGGPAKHPLSGIARCRGCGGPLYYFTDGAHDPTYACLAKNKGCPDRQRINAREAHRAVLRRLPAVIGRWADAQSPVDADPAANQRRDLAAQRVALKKREDDLFDLWADAAISQQQFREQNQRIIGERDSIDQQIAGLERQTRRTTAQMLTVGEAAQIASAADELLDDPEFLRVTFAGIFAEVTIGRTGKTTRVLFKNGPRTRPILTLIAAKLHGGITWGRTVSKIPR